MVEGDQFEEMDIDGLLETPKQWKDTNSMY